MKNILREIILDLETTGLNHSKGDKIIEIACIEVVNKEVTGRIFHTYLKNTRIISPGAFNIHGITNNFLRNKPLFKDILSNLISFIGNSKLIIHNAAFDIGFMNNELLKNKIPLISISNVIDTLDIARSKFPSSPVNLNSLCRKFKINLKNRTKHGALIDAKLLSHVYIKLSALKQSKLKLVRVRKKYLKNIFINKSKFKLNRKFILNMNEKLLYDNLLKKFFNSSRK